MVCVKAVPSREASQERSSTVHGPSCMTRRSILDIAFRAWLTHDPQQLLQGRRLRWRVLGEALLREEPTGFQAGRFRRGLLPLSEVRGPCRADGLEDGRLLGGRLLRGLLPELRRDRRRRRLGLWQSLRRPGEGRNEAPHPVGVDGPVGYERLTVQPAQERIHALLRQATRSCGAHPLFDELAVGLGERLAGTLSVRFGDGPLVLGLVCCEVLLVLGGLSLELLVVTHGLDPLLMLAGLELPVVDLLLGGHLPPRRVRREALVSLGRRVLLPRRRLGRGGSLRVRGSTGARLRRRRVRHGRRVLVLRLLLQRRRLPERRDRRRLPRLLDGLLLPRLLGRGLLRGS